MPDAKAEKNRAGLPVIAFRDDAAWEKWLAKNHSGSAGLWMEIAKVGSGIASVTYPEAVKTALCYGWIDGQKQAGETTWLQRFTPRGKRSGWSKLNRERVAALREEKRMRAPGEAEVERAMKDGRWKAAYDTPKTMRVPADFTAALAESKPAAAFYATLNSSNRYAILLRLQTAKKPETRARRLAGFVAMLARGEKPHP